MHEIDVRALPCPGPVIELRKLLDAGVREVRLHVADELARSNVTRFAISRRADVDAEPDGDGGYLVTVVASDASATVPEGGDQGLECPLPAETGPAPSRGPSVVQVTSDRMGRGDDELGGLLLRSFLKTQLQLDRKPDTILFYNSGVRLCCEGSSLLEDLRELERAGVTIIACGTCLNFFGLAPKLQVGRGSDMLEIATVLAEAGHIVTP